MADAKDHDSPPTIPPKEPIKPDKPEASVEIHKVNDQSQQGPKPEDVPLDGDMAPKGDHGKDEQEKSRRERARSYSAAAAGTSDQKKTENAPRPKPKIDAPILIDIDDKGDNGAQDAMELDTPRASMEDWDDAPAYQAPPVRGPALPPMAEEFEPFDDFSGFDSTSFSRRKDDAKVHEENARLRRHVTDLGRKIAALTTDKQIAEEQAERLTDRVNNMKQRMSSNMTEVERSSEALATKVEELTDENKALREQLNDAQSHIFSLQPYRKDLTPEEVGQEYDTLVEHIQDWVQKFMDPWLEDHDEGVEAMLAAARKRVTEANKFKRVLHQYPDLVHGSGFPETDEDIVTSIIMRFLHDNIFQTVLYGAIHNYVEVVSFIENNMQASVEPKRDLFSVRSWTAEAYNALLSAPQFKSVREKRRKEMTMELADTLKIFFKKDKWQWFCENLSERCVGPAMKLYEKMQVSTHHFYLDINPFIVWMGGELNTSPEFIDSVKKLDCKNVLKNRKAFSLDRLDPPPSKKELYHRLLNVCTVVPALYMRQIGQRDAIKEPMVVRKQQMLVAWGPEEKRRAYRENGERTLMSHLYSVKGSGEGWAPFWK
ncbi:hypothetical protein FALBO_11891 [Fusarium albosuccineum]|uniref:Uncharacterized protein n=1 Tax=Fusarium albosuccineum TaxID=1237068 RepID=A0A8H4L303_9HYPO|nr:hypothetical protein FALBO_11891 [Fusarium albosuccineum]